MYFDHNEVRMFANSQTLVLGGLWLYQVFIDCHRFTIHQSNFIKYLTPQTDFLKEWVPFWGRNSSPLTESESPEINSKFQIISNANQKTMPHLPGVSSPNRRDDDTIRSSITLKLSNRKLAAIFSINLSSAGFSFIDAQWIVTLHLTTKLRYDWLNTKLEL